MTNMGQEFTDDLDKMLDFYELSKDEFLHSYSYLTEDDYFATLDKITQEEQMSRKVFERIVELDGFDRAIQCYDSMLCPFGITDYDTLKDRAIDLLKENNVHWALHILNAIYDSSSESDWYYYDYSAGTTMTPKQLVDADDVAKWIGFKEE